MCACWEVKMCYSEMHSMDNFKVNSFDIESYYFESVPVLWYEGDELLHSSVWCVTCFGSAGISGLGQGAWSAYWAAQVTLNWRTHEAAEGLDTFH